MTALRLNSGVTHGVTHGVVGPWGNANTEDVADGAAGPDIARTARARASRHHSWTVMPTPAFWRKWHRWIGAPAALFMAYASLTGVLVAAQEFFGADEALREANRAMVSAVHTDTPTTQWSPVMVSAMSGAALQAPGAPVDKVTIELKGRSPTITVYIGHASGGEDKRLLFDGKTGKFLRVDDYSDKPLLHRIHSAEVFGDGGLVASMLWGIVLMALTISGFLLYWRLMRIDRPDRVGIKRYFF